MHFKSKMQRLQILRIGVRFKHTTPDSVSGTKKAPINPLAHRSPDASRLVDEFIRVDHAGELGADQIYAGQMAILGKAIFFAVK